MRAPAATSHRHTHSAVVVAVDGRNPRAAWVKQGTVHAAEGVSDASRFYVFEIK